MKSLIVIPARLQSSRLPRKMLLAETGRPLIQHTFQSAGTNTETQSILVATDDREIFDAVEAFGGRVEMTSADHVSGTDRVAEVAARHPEYDVVVNVQGDEPEIPGSAIDLAISILRDNPQAVMATLVTPIRSRKLLDDPACVKAVLDAAGRAMYFSRSPIPHPRQWSDELLAENPANFLQHIGLYAFRRDFLLKFPELPPCREESLESLEQLRVLSAGYQVFAGQIDAPIIGIDTREDYELFVSSIERG